MQICNKAMKLCFFFLVMLVSTTSYCLDAKSTEQTDIKQKLVAAAMAAREKAYAPYSNYKVGSALLTKEGKIITGSNVEIATYALTTCAERNAVFKAVTDGFKNFTMIAVVTKDGGFPCGTCRQVLNEFNPEIPIVIADDKGNIVHETNLAELFPHAWGPKNLNNNKK